MDYKYSKYNYCIPNKHGELLIYNSYSNRFVKIMGTKIGDIQKSIKNFHLCGWDIVRSGNKTMEI
jgi:hypothetical protein